MRKIDKLLSSAKCKARIDAEHRKHKDLVRTIGRMTTDQLCEIVYHEPSEDRVMEIFETVGDMRQKVVEYELQIEDMLHAFQERLAELEGKKDLTDFERGRLCAFTEVSDIIATRHQMILDVLEESG